MYNEKLLCEQRFRKQLERIKTFNISFEDRQFVLFIISRKLSELDVLQGVLKRHQDGSHKNTDLWKDCQSLRNFLIYLKHQHSSDSGKNDETNGFRGNQR